MDAIKVAGPAPSRSEVVQSRGRFLRRLFEAERGMIHLLCTLIPRVGPPELKYLLCQHVWEAATHARLLRERGKELGGFGTDEAVRTPFLSVVEEAASAESPEAGLCGAYRALKPALLEAYRAYEAGSDALADWPTLQLVGAFAGDEQRHAREMEGFLPAQTHPAWTEHLRQALAAAGGWSGLAEASPLPAGYRWRHREHPYRHPPTCNRAPYPRCSSVFGTDPEESPIVRPWLEDPKTDARVLRLMIYVWLMMELDAVDYLSTILVDTPHAPFALHYDLARHLWDESRHSQFGFRQLPRLGVDLNRLEHSVDLYHILVRLNPVERYAMMTMEFEAGSFATKAVLMDRIRELNDFEADTLLAFDRNDEQHHVRYGHRWLPVLMELFGEKRPVPEFIEATRARFMEAAQTHGGLEPHSLPAHERITASKLAALARAGRD